MKTSTKKVAKLVIEITTRELFHNYAQSTIDVAWESHVSDVDDRLADPLKVIHEEDPDSIARLFREGNTFMLLGEAAGMLDKYDVVEVIVTKRGGTTFVVDHNDINY